MKFKRFIKAFALLLAITVFFGCMASSMAAGGDAKKEREVLYLLNELRLSEGLYPLSSIDSLDAAASVRAQEQTREYGHTRPDGSSWYTVLSEKGVKYNTAAENVAAGYPTAEGVMQGWYESDGHRANMLDNELSHVGIGYRSSTGSYKHYWVQLFIGDCTVKSIKVKAVGTVPKYAVGTSIKEIADSMVYQVVGTCDKHGEFTLPLNAAMCSGFNSSELGKQEITVMCFGKTTKFSLTLSKGDPYVMGDVNRNGDLDVGDATLILRYIVGLIGDNDLNLDVADYNGDGKITSGDATGILRSIVSD